MTPCNILGCVIDDENRYNASSRAKKWNFTAVVVVVGHVIHPTPTIQQLGTSKRYLRYLRYL